MCKFFILAAVLCGVLTIPEMAAAERVAAAEKETVENRAAQNAAVETDSAATDAEEQPATESADQQDVTDAGEAPEKEPEEQPARVLALDKFRPRSMMAVESTDVAAARFPVVNVHAHFQYRFRQSKEQLDQFVRLMDRNNLAIYVSLDGRLGDEWGDHSEYLWGEYKQRFVIFVSLDWRGDGDPEDPSTWDCHRPDFARRTAKQLAIAKEKGASGLKLFKQMGLEYKNPDGSLVEIDDPRWDPIWEACGQLGLPIIIHTSDPAAFFEPVDERNERWEELHRRPEWSFHGDRFPSREDLLQSRNHVIGKHPNTIFIGAHMANNPENLAEVSQWLTRYPNLYVEFASRIAELGRQPYTARKFFMEHADRIMFGTDGPWPETRVRLYWRFLETFDEYFPYSEKPFPPQGFWNIYGLGLPDEVLRKIYFENASRVIPGVKERLEAWHKVETEAKLSEGPQAPGSAL